MIVDPDFLDHWKTRLLVNSLNDEVAPLYVLRLWAHCQNRRQHQFEKMSKEAIKALCRYSGDAALLESALSKAGFIRRDGDGIDVCNWDEYNSGLMANWENGKKGGRPKKPKNNPTETQIENGLTQSKPNGNPTETQTGIGLTQSKPIGGDEIGVEKIREESSPPPTREVVKSFTCPSTGDRIDITPQELDLWKVHNKDTLSELDKAWAKIRTADTHVRGSVAIRRYFNSWLAKPPDSRSARQTKKSVPKEEGSFF